MSFNWSDHLESALSRISELATGRTSLRVYRAGGRVALALPRDEQVAEMVLNLYQPQRFRGRMFKLMVGMLSQTNLSLASHVHEEKASKSPELSWLVEASHQGTLGFLGCNPSHGLRCIVAGNSPSSGESFIVKIGFDTSREAVRREYDNLLNLQGRYEGVIQAAGSLSGKDWFAIKLPYLGHTAPSHVTLPAVVYLLNSWQKQEFQRLDEWPVMRDILSRLQVDRELSGWHHQVGGLKLSKALVHGDFAMWNLRYTSNGLYAIDWEWADGDGISGIDLVHALRQEAIMVRKLGNSAALQWMQNEIKSATWNAYLKAGGWDKHLTDLLRIGLLHSHFVANCDSGEMLRMLGIQV